MKYAEYGLTKNETVIFLHGGGLAPWNYCDIAEQLKDRFHIIIPVLDGHNGSDTDFTTIENNADEIISTVFKAEKQDCLNRTVTQPMQSFNIKEERIIDFENLLNCIENISKYYRTEIEKILSKFIINYQVVKNTQYLQNDFDNVTNNYLNKIETTVNKFQKDENIEKGYIDYNKMLEENDFDIVSICTPIEFHYDIAKKCMETGVKAIFCEKTLSYSIEEAKSILELSKKYNIVFAVNYILRWDNINKQIKKLIEENAIGKIYTIVGYGATALHTSASHIIDLMLYFTNSEAEYVVGEKQTDFIREVHGISDHGGCGIIKFKSGAIGFIKAVSTSPFKYMLEMDIMVRMEE